MKENQLDPIDIRIIKELTLDARIPLIQLAKKLKVSNTLVHQRMKKLTKEGVLENATFKIDSTKLGYETTTYTLIMLEEAKIHRTVEQKLAKIPETVECVNIAGRYALMVKIHAFNNTHLRDIIYDKIHPIEGIEGTNTTFAFETVFSRNVPLG